VDTELRRPQTRRKNASSGNRIESEKDYIWLLRQIGDSAGGKGAGNGFDPYEAKLTSTQIMTFTLFNDHNVYILGAGFSAHRGLPLMTQFMRRMRDAHEYLAENDRRFEAEAIESVLQFRLKSAAAAYRVQLDLENIEELFSLASVAGNQYSEAIRLAIAATIDYAELTKPDPQSTLRVDFEGKPNILLPDAWPRQDVSVSPQRTFLEIKAPFYQVAIQSLLGFLGENTRGPRNTFISFNYDMLLEKALSALGHKFSYGFSSNQEIEILEPETSFPYSASSELRVLKLHGSMNWASQTDSTSICIGSEYRALRSESLIPELVPPTWRKSFTPAIQSVWASAVDAIRSATRLIVIGFSAPPSDLHFKYLMAAGLQENLSIRDIVFFDPDESTIRARAQVLFANLDRQPPVRVYSTPLEQLISNGTGAGTLAAYGRYFSSDVRSVHNPS
jgi:hypothetical protein